MAPIAIWVSATWSQSSAIASRSSFSLTVSAGLSARNRLASDFR